MQCCESVMRASLRVRHQKGHQAARGSAGGAAQRATHLRRPLAKSRRPAAVSSQPGRSSWSVRHPEPAGVFVDHNERIRRPPVVGLETLQCGWTDLRGYSPVLILLECEPQSVRQRTARCPRAPFSRRFPLGQRRDAATASTGPWHLLRDAVYAAAAVANDRARHADDLVVWDDLDERLERREVVLGP